MLFDPPAEESGTLPEPCVSIDISISGLSAWTKWVNRRAVHHVIVVKMVSSTAGCIAGISLVVIRHSGSGQNHPYDDRP